MPECFDTEDGLVGAFLLCELNHFSQGDGLDDEPIELVDLLAGPSTVYRAPATRAGLEQESVRRSMPRTHLGHRRWRPS
ncbi:hypothetical protein [Plantactinospora sp. BB1]|uniref:hypothetical protein n=1 Tax=Plantactinospora sp. BB1 TaxID=2071627 RepID=UPI00131F3248|nr:hypothetical protein [Plantactinospora sp. BB1]